MSGYLELKYPRSQMGLNPFKTWRRQWCILRPCPKRSGGVSLAVYSSEAGHSAGCIEIPRGSKITKAKSRSRTTAFAVYTPDKPQIPRVLLASHSEQDTQIWIDKINCMLNSETQIDTNLIIMDYFISMLCTDLAKKCGFHDIDAALSLTAQGLLFAEQAPKAHKVIVPWQNIIDVVYSGVFTTEKNKICSVTVDSGFAKGSGVLKFTTPSAPQLTKVLKQTLRRQLKKRDSLGKLSKSDSDLQRTARHEDSSTDDTVRDSWNSESSTYAVGKQAMADTGYHSDHNPTQNVVTGNFLPRTLLPLVSKDKSRRSLISVASGIYEEISDEPYQTTISSTDVATTEFQQDPTDGVGVALKENNRNRLNRSEDNLLNDSSKFLEEPMYESVSDCVFATMRRSGKRFNPPPLPPRMPLGTPKLTCWKPDNTAEEVAIHVSLGSLPQCSSTSSSTFDLKTKTLPKYDKTKSTFNVFRKRLKSDSIIHSSTKSETKDKDIDNKKKRFEFTPKKDIFKGFRKNKSGKNLTKAGESKSCENLDETDHVTCNRCSKSVESLDNDSFEDELSIDYNSDVPASLSLPPDIVELFLKSQERSVGVKCEVLGEDDYMPMSPAPVEEQHYIVMSPRSDLAST